MDETTSPTVIDPIQSAPSPIHETASGDLMLTAVGPGDMSQCQSALILWTEKKVAALKADQYELLAEVEVAKRRKWKWTIYQAHADKLGKRIVFYEKMRAALVEGYCIVPNFPVSLFAIRTDRKNPLKMWTNKSWNSKFIQDAKALPAGEGEYKSPNPVVMEGRSYEVTLKDGSKQTLQNAWADSWDGLEFPANMAKLEIMEAAERAMALKIFDEICMFPSDRQRHPDPVLFGTIIDKRNSYTVHRVSFMIGWHLNTKTL